MAVKYRMDESWLIHPGQISPALVQHVTPEIALSNRTKYCHCTLRNADCKYKVRNSKGLPQPVLDW